MFFQDCFFHLPSNRFSFVIASLIKYHNLDMIWPKRIESDWCGNWNSVHVTGELFSLQEHMLWVHVELVVNYHVLIILKSLSHVQLFATPWTAACQASLSSINSLSLLKLMSIELVRLSNHLILCGPLLLLPSVFPSIKDFLISQFFALGAKYWSFSFSISPSSEYAGLIYFRIDWFDLLAVQGTQESPPTPQFKSINSSVLNFPCSPTLPSYMTIGKNIACLDGPLLAK